LCVSRNFAPFFGFTAASARASVSVEVSGLSQMTWIPASRNAFAGAKWTLFGVTMATASMPSGRAV
jgi:hypothetical protein